MIYSIEKNEFGEKLPTKNVPNSKWMQMNLKIRLHCFIQSIVVVLLMTLRLVPMGGQSISSEWVELGKLVPKVLGV
jgi:hypothetical protein